MKERRSWALVALDQEDQPGTVLMLFDDPSEAEEIAFELRRSNMRVLVVPYGQERPAAE